MARRRSAICTNQQPPQRGGAVPDPVWVGSKWLLDFPRIPATPGTPLHFFAMLPPERQHTASLKSVACFLFSPARLRLLILLLLLMSGNVHPNPGPHLSLLCVRWKCDLAGKVSARLHLLQLGSSKVLTTLPLQIQNS